MTKARSTKILAAAMALLMVFLMLPTLTLPAKAADELPNFTVGETIYENDFSGANPLEGWTTSGNGTGWQWNADYGSASVSDGKFHISSSGGTKVATLPAVGTTNYVYSATFTLNNQSGSWGLLADMINPATSATGAMHAIVYSNGGTAKTGYDYSIYHYNRNGGAHNNPKYASIKDLFGANALTGDTYTLTLYHLDGNSYFCVNDTLVSTNTIANNTEDHDVVGIYTCGASVSVSSVSVKELKAPTTWNGYEIGKTIYQPTLTGSGNGVPEGWAAVPFNKVPWPNGNGSGGWADTSTTTINTSKFTYTADGLKVTLGSGDFGITFPGLVNSASKEVSDYVYSMRLSGLGSGSWSIGLTTGVDASASYVGGAQMMLYGAGATNSYRYYNIKDNTRSGNVEVKKTDANGFAIPADGKVTMTVYHVNGVNHYYFNGKEIATLNEVNYYNGAVLNGIGIAFSSTNGVVIEDITVKELLPIYNAENPYPISTPAQLADTATWANMPAVKLTANIDMTGVAYTAPASFVGTFDGDGHVISNLSASVVTGSSTAGNGGFVGNLYGTIKNVALLGMNVTATAGSDVYGGMFIGSMHSGALVSNVLIQGNATVNVENARFGTISGYNNTTGYTIENSAFIGGVSGPGGIFRVTGGNSNQGGIVIDSVYLALDATTAAKENSWTQGAVNGGPGSFADASRLYVTGTTANGILGGKAYSDMAVAGFFDGKTEAITVSDLQGTAMGFDAEEWITQSLRLPVQKVFASNYALISSAINGNTIGGFDTVGAGIRYADPEGNPERGLRFQVDLSKKSVLYTTYFGENDYAYSAEATVKFGVLLLPTDLLGANELTKDTAKVLDIPFEKIYAQDENTVSFMGALLKIPADKLSRFFTARAYVAIYNGESWEYYYEDVGIERSPVQIANIFYHDDEKCNDTIRARLDELFEGVENYEGANMTSVTFEMLADLHYKTGMYMSSIADMQTILDRANAADADLILHLGDFCNDYIGSPELFNTYLNNNYELPALGIYGNHELESENNSMDKVTPLLNNSIANVKVVWGTNDGKIGDGSIGYYYYDVNGFRFIGLDTNYSWNETAQEWQHNTTASYGPPSGNTKGNSLGPVQRAWLESVLDDAIENDLRCIILGHESFSGVWSAGGDAAEVRAIFNAANAQKRGTVMLVLNGHLHSDHAKMIDDILYIDVNTVRNGWWAGDQSTHHYTTETFDMITYDENGVAVSTTETLLTSLSQAKNTWFFTDPLSATVTVCSNGQITVDGVESTWFNDVAPSGVHSGVKPAITSGSYIVPIY